MHTYTDKTHYVDRHTCTHTLYHTCVLLTLVTLPPTEPVLDDSSPLTLLTSELRYEPSLQSAGIDVEFRDNAMALEEPQEVVLGIRLSSSQCYDLNITPTSITLLDDDGM